MMKNYNDTTQEELEKESSEIVKNDCEKNVALLDRYFNVKKYVPDRKRYRKGMTDK